MRRKFIVKRIFLLVAWAVTIGAILGSFFVLRIIATLPDPESIATRQIKESTKIYDRTGKVILYDIYKEERRTVVPLSRISKPAQQATIAIEDSRFYSHRGFDIKGFLRSVYLSFRYGYGEGGGGSTITQQLVGNALVGREKNLTRKIQELVLAIEVERRFSKDEILEMYLNQIPYGSNAYGIEAAAQTFFGVSAENLSTIQAATLAALPQRPSYLSPYGTHQDELILRRNTVLDRMFSLGFAEDKDVASAKSEKLVVQQRRDSLSAPHFVEMVREYAFQKYGTDIIEGGGFKIITTLDADLQAEAEKLTSKYAAINAKQYKAKNAALVAIEPSSGDVLALVGSANYFDIENEGNFNVATALRQPGSAFKPFAYATELAKGTPDATALWDVRTEFNPLCSPDSTQKKDKNGTDCYHPQNYSGTFSGAVTIRQALARSLNVPSVKTLYLAGIDNTINLATKMGITTLGDKSRFGLSLVLGGAEVKLVDLVSAYGVFGSDGMRSPWGLVQRIERGDGTIVEERLVEPIRALDQQTARTISDILSDNQARSSAFGASSALVVPGFSVAAKTGTTQENRDAWVVGYTPTVAVGVWTGNNHNESMTTTGAGISASGPLWNAFIRVALKKLPSNRFSPPDPVFSEKMMFNGQTSSSEFPEPHSILFFINQDDPQFKNWEWAVRIFNGL